MGTQIELTASDAHHLGAYRAEPSGAPRGAVVVIQEIFGVNSHIRSVCDRFAEIGYVAVAPAVFDRVERGFECGYSPDEIQHARGFMGRMDWDAMMRDVEAAVASVRPVGSVAVVGFCMGGSVAFLAAARLDGIAAAIGYYGGRIAKDADEKPRCPTQLHFGAEDQGIPLSDVESIRAKRPDCEIHVYEGAGHGFHCDERASYHPEAAAKAWQRTTDWMQRHMGKAG
jgi:carboxymethylenebutenolidase